MSLAEESVHFVRLWYDVPPFLSVILEVGSFLVRQIGFLSPCLTKQTLDESEHIRGQCARKDCRTELGYLLFSEDSLLRSWARFGGVQRCHNFHRKILETLNALKSQGVFLVRTCGDWQSFEFARLVLWNFVGELEGSFAV